MVHMYTNLMQQKHCFKTAQMVAFIRAGVFLGTLMLTDIDTKAHGENKKHLELKGLGGYCPFF